MKKKHIIITIILIAVIGIAVMAVTIFTTADKNLKIIMETTINEVDLSKIEDGVYTGSFGAIPVTAEVQVTVSNHKITDIKILKHDNGQGSAAEVLPDKVVEAQSLKVDLISGATYSSKVILKAIENALNGIK
jgi:uncharacterized protein with FMN-binding domain